MIFNVYFKTIFLIKKKLADPKSMFTLVAFQVVLEVKNPPTNGGDVRDEG